MGAGQTAFFDGQVSVKVDLDRTDVSRLRRIATTVLSMPSMKESHRGRVSHDVACEAVRLYGEGWPRPPWMLGNALLN